MLLESDAEDDSIVNHQSAAADVSASLEDTLPTSQSKYELGTYLTFPTCLFEEVEESFPNLKVIFNLVQPKMLLWDISQLSIIV